MPVNKNKLAQLEIPTPGEREPTTLADDLFEFEDLGASKTSSHCISQANSS
jgi:hypothetical protein